MKWSQLTIAFATTYIPFVFVSVLDCKVVTLSNDDTFTYLDAVKKQLKIRLANINTPEKNRPYGIKAKQVFNSLIFKNRY
jgi:endonuclease YncB( thermonuclease family)